MDKNSLTGMVLMGLVIFLFMWLNKPKQDQAALQETEQAAGLDNSGANKAEPLILTPEDINRLAPTVMSFGKQVEGETATYRLATSDLDITYTPALAADSVSGFSGSVNAGGVLVDIRNIIEGRFGQYTPETADAARRTLHDAIVNLNKYKSFAPFIGGDNKTVVLENDQMRVTFGSRGGRIQEVVLKKYDTETTTPPTPVTLFNAETAAYNFTFTTAEQRINTADLNFQASALNDSTVVMSLPLADGVTWQLRYTLVPDLYLVKMDLVQQGVGAVIPPSTTTLGMDWAMQLGRNEIGRTFEERNSAIYYKFTGEGPDDLDANGDDAEKLTGHIKWVAFKNQFFSSVIIPRQHFSTADIESHEIKNSEFLKDMSMQAVMPYSTADGSPVGFSWYFGPNSYPLLCDLDDALVADGGDSLELDRLVNLGWGLFRWINQLIVIPVFTFVSKFISNYGIIILILTLFIKLITFPFTYKSYMSQAKMRVLVPEIKEINDKYPGQENAMKRQQETMALYSRAGASPFSGCLPMMLQMPVLIAMFSFFPNAIELRGQSFLWAHDLSAPDVILSLPFTIPFYGNHVSLFCLLMTAVNIIYTRINMQNQPGGNSMPGMKWMMYLMPVMFLFFFNDYASGLSYYYFLSLLITIVQTYIFRRCVNEDKVRAEMLANAKKPRKKSGLMARLEEAQKKQEAYMREQSRQQARRRR